MNKPLTVALYSGVAKSTTFIERLKLGLAKNHIQVYVFGGKNTHVDSSKNIHYITFGNKWHKMVMFLKYSALLFLFKNSDKKKLDALIKLQTKSIRRSRLLYYPVLWHRPTIFHVQWAKGIDEWMWVKEFDIKLVLSLRGAHINYSPIADEDLAAMYRMHFPKLDGFHAVSNAIAKEAEIYGALPGKIKTIYSGLNLEQFYNLSTYKNGKRLKIISVGRQHWKKGYNYALDACKLIKEQKVLFDYEIIGASEDIELLYQLKDLDLYDEVTLQPSMPFNKIKEKICEADMLLLPSVEEGIANVVLEAMALRTLVLTTDCGGMTEVITNGDNGYIVPVRHSRAMAEKIIEISNLSESQYETITNEALKTIKNQHNEVQMLTGMVRFYEDINQNNELNG